MRSSRPRWVGWGRTTKRGGVGAHHQAMVVAVVSRPSEGWLRAVRACSGPLGETLLTQVSLLCGAFAPPRHRLRFQSPAAGPLHAPHAARLGAERQRGAARAARRGPAHVGHVWPRLCVSPGSQTSVVAGAGCAPLALHAAPRRCTAASALLQGRLCLHSPLQQGRGERRGAAEGAACSEGQQAGFCGGGLGGRVGASAPGALSPLLAALHACPATRPSLPILVRSPLAGCPSRCLPPGAVLPPHTPIACMACRTVAACAAWSAPSSRAAAVPLLFCRSLTSRWSCSWAPRHSTVQVIARGAGGSAPHAWLIPAAAAWCLPVTAPCLPSNVAQYFALALPSPSPFSLAVMVELNKAGMFGGGSLGRVKLPVRDLLQ